MNVNVSDLQNTLLQLLRDHRLGAGEEISLSDLETLWRGTTLRRADLLDGVVRLTATNLLSIEDRWGETLVSLTAAGVAAGHELSQPGQIPWTQHLHTVLLPAVRTRRVQPYPNGRGRRDYDARTEAQNQIRLGGASGPPRRRVQGFDT